MEDDAQVCSCHVSKESVEPQCAKLTLLRQNVSKGKIGQCIKNGECSSIGDLKAKTKVGTGCGGCMPLVCARNEMLHRRMIITT